ncbi:MAG: aldo/keto reductase [Cyclobacteriaceae bacterium]|nr:aldo/keto reductase [Cyclobacteriaceae bacterium HetDA_MAG_MS6]
MEQLGISQTFSLGGTTGINRLGFGALRITGKGGYGPPENPKDAINLLQEIPKLGINFIDTADSYGPFISEELIGEALYPYAEDMVIATKVGYERPGGIWKINNKPERMRKALEGSLKRLKLEQIDLYQLHRIDPKVPLEDQVGFMKEVQQEGLIKHIGLSEVSVKEIEDAQQIAPIASVQNKYSYHDRQSEDVLNFTREHDIAFIPWYPLDAGRVVGKVKMKVIAEKHGLSLHQVAISWLLHHAPHIIAIPGTSNLNHLRDNAKIGESSLTEEVMHFLDTTDA